VAKTKLVGSDREKKLQQRKKAAKTANRKKRKSPIRYFKDVFAELRKVTWPTFKDLMIYTGAVIAFIAVLVVIIYLFDLGLGALMHLAIS